MTDFPYILIAIGGLFSLLNWGTLIASFRTKRFVSAVPLVGAIPLGFGLAMIPETRSFVWLAVIGDYGTLILIIALPRIVYEFWSTSRFNLLRCFRSTAAGREVLIKLFRQQMAVISVTFDPPVQRDEPGARLQSFGRVGKWKHLDSGYLIDGYYSNGQLLISSTGGAFHVEELNRPESAYDYERLNGIALEEI